MFTINSLGWLHLTTITNEKKNSKFWKKMSEKHFLKRAFSAMGFFATKIRNRMGDKTLDALITMWQFYKKPGKVEELTSYLHIQ